MIKIHATVSKKVPIPGRDYSSQSYSAGIELELADAATKDQLEQRIREVYGLLEHTIDTENHPMAYRSTVLLIVSLDALVGEDAISFRHLLRPAGLALWDQVNVTPHEVCLYVEDAVWTEGHAEVRAVHALLHDLAPDHYRLFRLGDNNADIELRGSYWGTDVRLNRSLEWDPEAGTRIGGADLADDEWLAQALHLIEVYRVCPACA